MVVWNGVPVFRTKAKTPCFPGLTPVINDVQADMEFVGITDSRGAETPDLTKVSSVGMAPSANSSRRADQSAPSSPIITTLGGLALRIAQPVDVLLCHSLMRLIPHWQLLQGALEQLRQTPLALWTPPRVAPAAHPESAEALLRRPHRRRGLRRRQAGRIAQQRQAGQHPRCAGGGQDGLRARPLRLLPVGTGTWHTLGAAASIRSSWRGLRQREFHRVADLHAVSLHDAGVHLQHVECTLLRSVEGELRVRHPRLR